MAGKSKSMYLTIAPRDNILKPVLKTKIFYSAKELNDYIKEAEKEYPKDKFQYIKETF